MNRYQLEKRMQELEIYSYFYYRKEIKALPQLLSDDEQLNCILTGVHEANRKMLVVTNRRLLIIFAAALSGKDVTVIQRSAVQSYEFEKKLLFSKLSIRTTTGEDFLFTNVQGSLKELFDWAMKQAIPA